MGDGEIFLSLCDLFAESCNLFNGLFFSSRCFSLRYLNDVTILVKSLSDSVHRNFCFQICFIVEPSTNGLMQQTQLINTSNSHHDSSVASQSETELRCDIISASGERGYG